MVDEPGRLARIERKIDGMTEKLAHWRVESEHRFTKLEVTAKAAGRKAGLWWGFGAGLVGSIVTAWLSKHI